MATYLVSTLIAIIVIAMVFGKRAYQKKFTIILLAAGIAFVPMAVLNAVGAKSAERETVIMRTRILSPVEGDSVQVNDSMVRVTPHFALLREDSNILIRTKGGTLSFSYEEINIHFFERDSNSLKLDSSSEVDRKTIVTEIHSPLPYYEITKEEAVKAPNIWCSTLGMPKINKKYNLHLPKDSVHFAIVQNMRRKKS